MTIKRIIEVPDDGFFLTGDTIDFTLTDGEPVQALAVKPEPDGVIFILSDCLIQKYRMNQKATNVGGYDVSNLRIKLNREILGSFPAELVNRMVPFPNGDTLRLPTEMEIFGANHYGTIEPDTVQRWDPMKQRKNRTAVQGNSGTGAWYWIANAMRNSDDLFLIANNIGGVHCCDAHVFMNVRPVFKLCNP